MAKRDGTTIPWEAGVGLAVFSIIVSEFLICNVFFHQCSLGPVSTFSRFTHLFGLVAAAFVVPVPLFSIMGLKRNLLLLPTTADAHQEIPAVFQKLLSGTLIATYVVIQSITIALADVIYP
jgi:hypothetical protein